MGYPNALAEPDRRVRERIPTDRRTVVVTERIDR
jgi:hypothetical protein